MIANRGARNPYGAGCRVALAGAKCHTAGHKNFAGQQQNRVGVRILDQVNGIVPRTLRCARPDIGVRPGQLRLASGNRGCRTSHRRNRKVNVRNSRLYKLKRAHVRVVPIDIWDAGLCQHKRIVVARIAHGVGEQIIRRRAVGRVNRQRTVVEAEIGRGIIDIDGICRNVADAARRIGHARIIRHVRNAGPYV